MEKYDLPGIYLREETVMLFETYPFNLKFLVLKDKYEINQFTI